MSAPEPARVADDLPQWWVHPTSGVVHHVTTACKGRASLVPWSSESALPDERGCRVCGIEWTSTA